MAERVQNLRRFLEEVAKEQNYSRGDIDIQAVSSGGGNFSSALFEVFFTESGNDDLNLFVKVASVAEALRDNDTEMFNRAYRTEKIFYTDLAVLFEELYDKNNVSVENRMRIPKYYGSNPDRLEETMVLENLALQGFESFDRTRTVDWEYASRSVEELAKFHALGLVYRTEHEEELKKIGKTVFCNMWSNEDMKNTFLNLAIKMGTQVIKEEYRQKVQEFLKKVNLLDGIEKLWRPSDKGYLIHSDYRPSNLLHRSRNRKLDVVIVDYQTLHLGTLAADLMLFIWTSSDSQFRQEHYHRLLEHYYKQLTLALQHLHYDINDVYPRSTFEQELEDTKTLGLFVGLGMMNILTVDPEDAPQLDSFENFSLTPNARAVDRMNGVVEDYIRWGII